MFKEGLPEKVRVSIGSAIVLGLAKGMLGAEPTTIYLLTYTLGKCSAACAFCPQSRRSDGRADMLSRVLWPAFQTDAVLSKIAKVFKEGKIKRVCIQALNYPNVQEDIIGLARGIHSLCQVPISVSCQPVNRENMLQLAKSGVDHISVALDAVTKELFNEVKGVSIAGPYIWERHFEALLEAVQVFGRDSVITHIIVGLGEKEEDTVVMLQRCVDLGVYPALFAFTPIRGTDMANKPPPLLDYYRRIQVAHYLITRRIRRYEDMKFKDCQLIDLGLSARKLQRIIRTGEPFRTSGCPSCNRPYYNESPRGPLYNYPRKPTAEEIAEIEKQLDL